MYVQKHGNCSFGSYKTVNNGITEHIKHDAIILLSQTDCYQIVA
jgi:hypothetical protein